MRQDIRERIEQIQRGEVPEGYKKTKVGIIPKDWDCELGKNIFIHKKSKGRAGIPVYSVTLDRGLVLRDSLDRKMAPDLPAEKSLLVEKDELVYNMMRMWQGAYDYAKDPGLVSPAYVVVKGREDINIKYIYYLLRLEQYQYYLKAYSFGITGDRLRLYFKDFADIYFIVPSYKEQERIIKILTTLDKAIGKQDELIKLKQKQKKGLMQELLSGKKRLDGFSSEWKKISFEKVFSKIAVKKNQIKSLEYETEGTYPVIDQGKKKIVAYSNNDSKVFECPKKGIVVFGDHTRELKFIDFNFIVGADGTQVLETNKKYNIKFFYYKLLLKKIPNTGYNRHFKYLKEMIFSTPELEEQKAIAEILSTADKEIELLEKELEQMKKQKKGLMQLLLTGIVRVN